MTDQSSLTLQYRAAPTNSSPSGALLTIRQKETISHFKIDKLTTKKILWLKQTTIQWNPTFNYVARSDRSFNHDGSIAKLREKRLTRKYCNSWPCCVIWKKPRSNQKADHDANPPSNAKSETTLFAPNDASIHPITSKERKEH